MKVEPLESIAQAAERGDLVEVTLRNLDRVISMAIGKRRSYETSAGTRRSFADPDFRAVLMAFAMAVELAPQRELPVKQRVQAAIKHALQRPEYRELIMAEVAKLEKELSQ